MLIYPVRSCTVAFETSLLTQAIPFLHGFFDWHVSLDAIFSPFCAFSVNLDPSALAFRHLKLRPSHNLSFDELRGKET